MNTSLVQSIVAAEICAPKEWAVTRVWVEHFTDGDMTALHCAAQGMFSVGKGFKRLDNFNNPAKTFVSYLLNFTAGDLEATPPRSPVITSLGGEGLGPEVYEADGRHRGSATARGPRSPGRVPAIIHQLNRIWMWAEEVNSFYVEPNFTQVLKGMGGEDRRAHYSAPPA
jgi:hypothetical protein